MSDTPTKNPLKGMTEKHPMPKRIKGMKDATDNPNLGGAVKNIGNAKGYTTLPMPAKPKESGDSSTRGAVKPWKSRGIKAKSKGSMDVPSTPVSKRMKQSNDGISLKTGYKKL